MPEPTPHQLNRHPYYIDRCRECLEPVDRDFLNDAGACRDCTARQFADYLEAHPHASRAEIMAEGRQNGLADAHINLIMSIHRMNWAGQ